MSKLNMSGDKMAKKPVLSKIMCELCNENSVSKERMDLIGNAICLECAEKDHSQTMAVQDCDKDGVVEMNFVDSKTFNTYAKNGKNLNFSGD